MVEKKYVTGRLRVRLANALRATHMPTCRANATGLSYAHVELCVAEADMATAPSPLTSIGYLKVTDADGKLDADEFRGFFDCLNLASNCRCAFMPYYPL